MPGLFRAVPNRYPAKISPNSIHPKMAFGLVQGRKNAMKAIIGLAIACRVTLKLDEILQKWSKMDQNGPKWTKMGQNGPKWSKMVKG